MKRCPEISRLLWPGIHKRKSIIPASFNLDIFIWKNFRMERGKSEFDLQVLIWLETMKKIKEKTIAEQIKLRISRKSKMRKTEKIRTGKPNKANCWRFLTSLWKKKELVTGEGDIYSNEKIVIHKFLSERLCHCNNDVQFWNKERIPEEMCWSYLH